MFILSANTYTESYGVEITLFGVYESKEECVERMKFYNTVEIPKLKKKIARFLEIENTYNEECNALYHELRSFGIDVYSHKIFEFDLQHVERYINEYVNNTALCLGGYVE